jgi:hypothetical protein
MGFAYVKAGSGPELLGNHATRIRIAIDALWREIWSIKGR